MQKAIKLSIILPCYNEEGNINRLTSDYHKLLLENPDVEVVFVDNGSTDNTAEHLKKALKEMTNCNVKICKVEINQGYGFGILSGLAEATGEYLCWSHADNQCPANDVSKLFEKILKESHPENCFGKGYRTNDRGKAKLLTQFQELLSQIVLGAKLVEINAQPKIFHRKFYETFKLAPKGYELDVYAYFKAVYENYKIISIDVSFLERATGSSKWAYSTLSRIKLIIRNIKYLFFLKFNRNEL